MVILTYTVSFSCMHADIFQFSQPVTTSPPPVRGLPYPTWMGYLQIDHFRQNDCKGCSLDYLDGLVSSFLVFGRQGKILKGRVPLAKTRVRSLWLIYGCSTHILKEKNVTLLLTDWNHDKQVLGIKSILIFPITQIFITLNSNKGHYLPPSCSFKGLYAGLVSPSFDHVMIPELGDWLRFQAKVMSAMAKLLFRKRKDTSSANLATTFTVLWFRKTTIPHRAKIWILARVF